MVDGEMEMDFDEVYAPTEEEVAAEEDEEPLMMANAQRWDNFIALIESSARAWPQGAEDTDEYRKARAVEYFNLAAVVACDLLELKATMGTWVCRT